MNIQTHNPKNKPQYRTIAVRIPLKEYEWVTKLADEAGLAYGAFLYRTFREAMVEDRCLKIMQKVLSDTESMARHFAHETIQAIQETLKDSVDKNWPESTFHIENFGP